MISHSEIPFSSHSAAIFSAKEGECLINLPAIFIANGLGAMLTLTLILSSRKVTRSVFFDDKLFYLMCNFTLYLCVAEAFSFLVDGMLFPGSFFLNRLLNASLFFTNSLFSFLWTVYVDYKLFGRMDRIRRIYTWASLPALIICVLSVLNLFTDVFFTVSPENVYARMPLASITYLATYGYLLAGAITVIVYRHKVGKYLFMPVVVFLSPIYLGSLLQFLFYGIALIWVSVSFGLVSLYINLQNEVSMLDPLTKLYNREYLTRFLSYSAQKLPKDHQLGGIMMDINAFKEINDTYGHSEGDIALRVVGKCLMDVMHGDNFAVRYGGDEFIAICHVHDEQDLQALIAKLCKRVERENSVCARPYQLRLSIGYTLYAPETDDLDSFLRRMDARMYEEKRRFYSDAKNNRRHRRDDA